MVGNISTRQEMPLTNILEIEVFIIWDIEFMVPFSQSFGNLYIFLLVNYVSKWTEAITIPINDAKVVTKFLIKNIFSRHDTPKGIISNEGNHFCNIFFEYLMNKYGVKHKVAKTFHP